MHFPFHLQKAIFLERPNRFRVIAHLSDSGDVVSAHCPNPGRLGELLLPGATIYISKAATTAKATTERKTAYDLRLVEHPQHGQLISLDTRLPNKLFAEGLQQGFFAPFRGATFWQSEVASDIATSDAKIHSRFDFRLIDAKGQPCWVEVKSVSLVENRTALFPDAPTARGRRHVEELAQLAVSGTRAALVFLVQRADADRLKANRATDLAFAAALSNAKKAGVEIYAYTCRITLQEATLDREIPVEFE